jgi:hypothetical protein
MKYILPNNINPFVHTLLQCTVYYKIYSIQYVHAVYI